MVEVLQLLGFSLLFLRFTFWVGSSLFIVEKQWLRVLIAQGMEGMLLFLVFAQLFGRVDVLTFPHNVFVACSGFLLTCMGVASAFVAKNQLGNVWVYAAGYRVMPQQKLITTGLYRWVRHPIYMGIIMSYVGIELLAGSWLWVSALFLMIPFFLQAKREEKLLLKHFGKQYENYQKTTGMLLPKIF